MAITWTIKLIHLSRFLQSKRQFIIGIKIIVPLTLIAFGQDFRRDPNRTQITLSGDWPVASASNSLSANRLIHYTLLSRRYAQAFEQRQN